MSISSGELARLAGVSSDTLRHYERVGVLQRPARSANNYRAYPEESIARVLLIRRALAFGFSLAELTLVLRERDKGGLPCRKVRAIAAAKLVSTEARLVELTQLRNDLRALLDTWDGVLGATPAGQRAHLLDSLPVLSAPIKEKKKHDEPDDTRPRGGSHRLAGHWSHESSEKRTPARGRSKR